MEYHPFWFGVRLEFVCSLCCITSVKMGIINWPSDDIEKVKSRIDRKSVSCVHCKAALGHGTSVDVAIVPGTPEYLETIGFQIPAVRRSQRDKQSQWFPNAGPTATSELAGNYRRAT